MELQRLEESLDIKRLDDDEVLFRHPFGMGDQEAIEKAARGLRELEVGAETGGTAVDETVSEERNTKSLAVTKGDYMRTRDCLECSDSLMELWWQWYVKGEG